MPLQTVSSPGSTRNMRLWSRPKSSPFDTCKTRTSHTTNRVDRAVNPSKSRLKEWQEQVAADLFFAKDKTTKTFSKEEPVERNQRYCACFLSGVRRLWKGILHVLRNYGIIWTLESIGTEIIHTPMKLFLYYGARHYPSIYGVLRNGLVTCSSHFDILATSVEGMLLLLFPVLFCHRFTMLKDQDIQSARTTSTSINARWVDAVLVAPIYEEFVYRFLFRQVWMRLMHLKKWLKEKFMADEKATTDRKQEDLVDLSESWILPSSFLFGVAHVGNWMPLDRKYFWDEILIFLRLVARKDIHRYPMRRRSEQNLLCSIYQQQHALVLSLICFAPVYQHLGMMGSIGSHAILNLIAICIPNHRYLLALLSVVVSEFTRTSRLWNLFDVDVRVQGSVAE